MTTRDPRLNGLRRKVHTNIALGTAMTLVSTLLAYCYLPTPDANLDTPTNRLVFTLRWMSISTLPMLIGIWQVGDVRHNTMAINPLSGNEHLHFVESKTFQNTLEQFALHVLAMFLFAVNVKPTSMHMVPYFVVMFLVGRICFIFGYRMDPMKRGFGFILTCFPTIGIIAFSLGCLLITGAGAEL